MSWGHTFFDLRPPGSWGAVIYSMEAFVQNEGQPGCRLHHTPGECSAPDWDPTDVCKHTQSEDNNHQL